MRIGNYETLSQLAVGEYSVVYRARPLVAAAKAIEAPQLPECAIKLLHPHLAHDPVVRERFIDDARTLAAIAHPNVLATTDLIIEDERVAVVVPLLDGGTLRDADPRGVDPLPLLRGALAGLAELHRRGIVHGNLHEGHIGFRDATRTTPCILDATGADLRLLAGLSRSTVIGRTGRHADPYATPASSGAGPTAGGDLYALGSIVSELLDSRDEPPDSAIRRIVTRMTAVPARRVRTAVEALDLCRGDGRAPSFGECIYCGYPMPIDAPVCVSCGREPPIFELDPEGSSLTLDRIGEKREVLGPFLRKLRLLSADECEIPLLLTGDARMYSREEQKLGMRLPVRIVDGIAEASVKPLIRLLEGDHAREIHITERPKRRLRFIKRGPLITILPRTALPKSRIDVLRASAAPSPEPAPTAGTPQPKIGPAVDEYPSRVSPAAGRTIAQTDTPDQTNRRPKPAVSDDQTKRIRLSVGVAMTRLAADPLTSGLIGDEDARKLIALLDAAANRVRAAQAGWRGYDPFAAYTAVERGALLPNDVEARRAAERGADTIRRYVAERRASEAAQQELEEILRSLERITPENAAETLRWISAKLRR